MLANKFKNQSAPAGFDLPKAALAILEAGQASGWVVGWQWQKDSADHPFVTVHVGANGSGEYFMYSWHSRTGTMRLMHKQHRSAAGHMWKVGPSLKSVAVYLRATPVPTVQVAA